jgi:hypothetical protein
MHKSIQRWFASAVLAGGLVLAGAGMAQQTKGPPKTLSGLPVPLSVDDVVERIMSFDKNKDAKVTKDELPERMHYLIEQGDSNKDGALDRDEIGKLAAKLGPAAPAKFAERYMVGPAPAGFVPPASERLVFERLGIVRDSLGRDVVEGIVKDLNLSGKKKEQAMAAAKAHKENVRKLMEEARADVLAKMKEILSPEEFKEFQATLAIPPRRRGVPAFTTPGGSLRRPDPPRK